jgi:hypothetical protein
MPASRQNRTTFPCGRSWREAQAVIDRERHSDFP